METTGGPEHEKNSNAYIGSVFTCARFIVKIGVRKGDSPILSLLGEAEPQRKLCEKLMNFIDAHDNLKRYREENINIDCRKKNDQ